MSFSPPKSDPISQSQNQLSASQSSEGVVNDIYMSTIPSHPLRSNINQKKLFNRKFLILSTENMHPNELDSQLSS